MVIYDVEQNRVRYRVQSLNIVRVVIILLSESYSFVTPVKEICNKGVHWLFVYLEVRDDGRMVCNFYGGYHNSINKYKVYL